MNNQALNPDLICQVGFIVRDIEWASRKFCEVFGFPQPPIIVTPGFDRAKTTFHGQPSEATAKLAFFNTGQLQIELIEPDEKPSVWREFLDQHGGGVQHIAFRVKDTKATTDQLTQRGIKTFQQGLYADASGMYTYVDSAPALGVMVELLENFNRA